MVLRGWSYLLRFGLMILLRKNTQVQKSYSSFMSKITVEEQNAFDYDIYMNHVLDHKGYRFFKLHFDPDEKGTVLSVNHDFGGLGLPIQVIFFSI